MCITSFYESYFKNILLYIYKHSAIKNYSVHMCVMPRAVFFFGWICSFFSIEPSGTREMKSKQNLFAYRKDLPRKGLLDVVVNPPIRLLCECWLFGQFLWVVGNSWPRTTTSRRKMLKTTKNTHSTTHHPKKQSKSTSKQLWISFDTLSKQKGNWNILKCIKWAKLDSLCSILKGRHLYLLLVIQGKAK